VVTAPSFSEYNILIGVSIGVGITVAAVGLGIAMGYLHVGKK
jgi:hypothetical protein